MSSKEFVQVRLPKTEKEKLDNYCKQVGRTQTDVIREFIRSLPD
ncbi:MAG: ribbon-helix-helix protein, CopG family [Leptolyngbyaceae cyanobacterium CSU_1_3]|nr:ribbon-helix-helix protein, CopG family [Leptolyngbyaceae cyanobacterium CSU_1_3]